MNWQFVRTKISDDQGWDAPCGAIPGLRPLLLVLPLLGLASGCGGDDDQGSASASATEGTTTPGVTTDATTAGSDSEGTTTGESASEAGSASESAGMTTTTTTGDPSESESDATTAAPTTSASSESDATTAAPTTTEVTATDSDGTTTDDTDSTTGPNCDGMGGNEEDALSVIWIANSAQGTVSKIDTKTGQELGRYQTRPGGGGSPSRTSVNRHGDVAVANRQGGVTKVIARPELCPDLNNDGIIQTSTGAGDILAWGADECVAFHTPIPHNDNRPVAWTGGNFNEETCEWEDLHVWTAWSDWAPGTAVVALIDGETGAILQEVPIPDLPNPWPNWHGFYGAAVDGANNVYMTQLQGANPDPAWLVRVNIDDFTYDHWQVPEQGGYGMTVTSEGYVWICGRSTRRFDPMTEEWTQVPTVNGGVHTGGCMGDGDGILYRGAYSQILGLDTTTMEVVKTLNVGQPGDDHIWGVAVDFDGNVWGVPRNGSRAYKVNPDTGVIEIIFQGLTGAYTYSDMTGFALFNVKPL